MDDVEVSRLLPIPESPLALVSVVTASVCASSFSVAHVAVVVEEAGSLVVVTFTLPQQTRQIDHLPKQNGPWNRTCNPKNTAKLFVAIGSIGCVTWSILKIYRSLT